MRDYYDLLHQIEQKPALFLGSPSLSNLYMFLTGYQFARRESKLPLSPQEREFQGFQPWLQDRLGIKTSQSWSQLILFHSTDERDAFERFFRLFDEFVQCQHPSHARQVREDELAIA
jgi:hypothetical protein